MGLISSDNEIMKEYGLPTGRIKCKSVSWSHRVRSSGPLKFEFYKVYQIVKPSKRSRTNRNDMVKLDDCLSVSRKIRNCKAIILEKYRIVKFKPFGIFADYYAIIKLLEGELEGEIRKITPGKLEVIQRGGMI